MKAAFNGFLESLTALSNFSFSNKKDISL